MLKISRIHVSNFKSILETIFDLEDVQLLIGPNNSGKSNLLKVFQFLRDVHHQDSLRSIDIEKIRHKHKRNIKSDLQPIYPDPVSICVEFTKNEKKDKKYHYYKLEIFYKPKPTPLLNNVSYNDSTFNEFVGESKTRLNISALKKFELNNSVYNLRNQFQQFIINKNGTTNYKDEEEELKDYITKNGFGNFTFNNQYIIGYSEKNNFSNLGENLEIGSVFRRFGVERVFQNNLDSIKDCLKNLELYKIDPFYLKLPGKIKEERRIDGLGTNIVSFLEFMTNSDRKGFTNKLEKELSKCIPDLTEVNFLPTEIDEYDAQQNVNLKKSAKYLRLKDRFGVTHDTVDVSEGTLYFLMLLSIILQPNPPSILMIEEPETGIHPRRIREVLDYIFSIREDYPQIPIIITTHHPYVVDYFSDMPEKIWVFENENGETKIKNLQKDIITPTNKKLKDEDIDPIDFASSLGEHWALGFLGGVPK